MSQLLRESADAPGFAERRVFKAKQRDVCGVCPKSERTLIASCGCLDAATASASCWTGGVLSSPICASIALAGSLDWLVDDLGRRLGLPVGVELRVVA